MQEAKIEFGYSPYKVQDIIDQIHDSLTQQELDEFTDQWLERVNYKMDDAEIMEKASELPKADIQELADEAMSRKELLEWALEVSHDNVLGVLEDTLEVDQIYQLAEKVLDPEYVEDLAKEVLDKDAIKRLAGSLEGEDLEEVLKDMGYKPILDV
jgi:ribosomal protein L12E/L44/L45/RPP1/RPP2